MKQDIEDKLIELTGRNTQSEVTNNTTTAEKALIRPTTKVVEIEDFLDKKQDKALTETDYLILTEYAKATPENVICEEFNIQRSYLQKLLRNTNALDFLKKYKSNTEMQMMIRGSSAMSRVLEKKLTQIDNLLVEGKDEIAFREMFGKLSFVEIQEKLAKINQGETEDKTAPLQNFFLTLQG